MTGVATLLAGRFGMTGNAGGSYALEIVGCASADGACCGFLAGGCGRAFAGLATRDGPLGGPTGGGGVTPGGA